MKDEATKILRPLLLSLVLSLMAIFVVMRVSVGPRTWEALREMDHLLFLYCLILVFVAWSCNGIRMRLMTGALGYRIPLARCIRITLSSEFGIAATPSGVGGGFLRVYLLRGQGVPVGQAMSVLATDMAIDVVFSLLILPFALPSFLRIFRPLLRNPLEAISVTIGGLFLFVLLGGYLWYRWSANSPAAATEDIGSESAARGLRGFFLHGKAMFREWSTEFRSGFSTLLRLRRPTLAAAFLVSVVQWSSRYGVLVLILRGLGSPANPFALFLLQAVLFFGGLLLVIPGGGGGVEFAFAVTISQLVPPGIVGVALVLWRFFTYYLYLLGGGTMLLLTVGKGGFSGSIRGMPEDLASADQA